MTSGSPDDADVRLEPVGLALARVGSELESIVGMIDEIEAVVGHAIDNAKTNKEVRIAELQQLDRVRQKIEGAAGFLNALTEKLPREWLVDAGHAARGVRMSELARHLGGMQGLPDLPAPDDVYELF